MLHNVSMPPWQAPNRPSLRDICDTIFRHKKKSIVFLLCALVIGGGVTRNMPKTYTSEAKILVTRGRESMSLQPTADTGKILPVYRDWVHELNSEFEILQSHDLISGVVAELTPQVVLGTPGSSPEKGGQSGSKLGRMMRSRLRRLPLVGGHLAAASAPPVLDPVGLERSAQRHLKSNFNCKRVRKSDVICIRYTDRNRLLSQRVASTLVSHYLSKHIEVHRRAGVYDFFERQLSELSAELAQTEEKLRDLKNRMGISSLGEQRNITLNHIKLLHDQKETLGGSISASAAKIRTLRSQLATRDATLARTVGAPRRKDIDDMTSQLITEEIALVALKANVDALEAQMAAIGRQRVTPDQLDELRVQRSAARGLYAAAVAKVAALKMMLGKSDKPLRAAGAPVDMNNYNDIQSALWEAETEFASQVAQARTIETQLTDSGDKILALNNDDTNIRRLERQQSEIEAKMHKYTASLEQVRINRELEASKISNLKIIQPATDPIWSDGSPRSLIMMLSLLIGVTGGIGLAFASEQFDHTVRRPEDISRELDLRLLTTIPKMSPNRPTSSHARELKDRWWGKARRWGGWPVRQEAQHHYALLRDRVMAAAQGHTARPVLLGLTSCHRGEGVSSIASDLAVTLARQGTEFPVLLVDPCQYRPDADASKHAISKATQITLEANGQIKMLERKFSVIDPDYEAKSEQTAATGSTFRDLIHFLRTHDSSFIVLDLPPLKEGDHVLELVAMLDNTIVVVESERTRWETVRWASDLLNEAGSNALGIVLNKRAYYVPNWLYNRL